MKYYIRLKNHIGPILKSIRKEQHLTQKEAAHMAGILPKTISALESGNINCSIDSYMKLITAYRYVQILEPISLPNEEDK